MSFKRYRMLKLLIPVFIAFYLLMVGMRSVIAENHAQVYPFFSWRLFSAIPDWEISRYAVIAHSIGGTSPAPSETYLIPRDSQSDVLELKRLVRACPRFEKCTKKVGNYLYPILVRITGEDDIEFSIIKAKIYLKDVQRGIDIIADRSAERSDFYQPEATLARWKVSNGQLRILYTQSTIDLYNQGFSVNLEDNTVVYSKEYCKPSDMGAAIFLHIYPMIPDDSLPFGFENLDFVFEDNSYSFTDGGRCKAIKKLPNYLIKRLVTGQSDSGQRIWEVDLQFRKR